VPLDLAPFRRAGVGLSMDEFEQLVMDAVLTAGLFARGMAELGGDGLAEVLAMMVTVNGGELTEWCDAPSPSLHASRNRSRRRVGDESGQWRG
jgi:hypothetical protein